jgi:hypothetical protein
MKRHVLGIALAFLPACIKETPVAEEQPQGQQAAEQRLSAEIGPLCDKGCAKNTECGWNTSEDCPASCREYLNAFVGHGDSCVALGQGIVDCASKLETCEDYEDTGDCDVSELEHAQCAAGEDAPPPVYCDGGGSTSAGVAPGADGKPAMTTSCDVYYGECSDSAEYRVSCRPIDGTMVCNCFRDGVVNGSAFTPIDDTCPSFEEINQPCGWNILD